MTKTITVISTHSCPGEKIGIGKTGGLAIYVKNLLNFLQDNNYNINFITKNHANCNLLFSNKVNILHLDSLTNPNLEVHQIAKNTDILISNYWTSGIFSKTFFVKKNIIKVNISHTLEYLKKVQIPNYKIDINRIKEEKLLKNYFDYTVYFSEEEKYTLINYYKYSKSKLIFSTPGYDQMIFYPLKKSNSNKIININTYKKTLLFVGRLDYLKGLDIAIEVIKIANNNNKFYKLLIAGGDLGSDEQKKLVSMLETNNISQHINWLGSLSQEKLNSAYNSVDIVIVPSRSETFGLVCLEAIATKTPVIVSNVGRMRDMVVNYDSGVLISDINPINFYNEIRRFFDKKSSFKLSKESLEKIKFFTWEAVFKELLSKII
jgi:D-inositol-3-phosphate glycosyltransferase|tara:strand:+ start:3357 stop:4484 length:1128 start_codon:yes stop_codon:yes gene_type:complete